MKLIYLVLLILLAFQQTQQFNTPQNSNRNENLRKDSNLGIVGQCIETQRVSLGSIYKCSIETDSQFSEKLSQKEASQQLQNAVQQVQEYTEGLIIQFDIKLSECPNLQSLDVFLTTQEIFENVKVLDIDLDLSGLQDSNGITEILQFSKKLEILSFSVNMKAMQAAKLKLNKIDTPIKQLTLKVKDSQQFVLGISDLLSLNIIDFSGLQEFNFTLVDSPISELMIIGNSQQMSNLQNLSLDFQNLQIGDVTDYQLIYNVLDEKNYLKNPKLEKLSLKFQNITIMFILPIFELQNAVYLVKLKEINLGFIENTKNDEVLNFVPISNFLIPLGTQSLKLFNLECINQFQNLRSLNTFVENCQKVQILKVKIGKSQSDFKQEVILLEIDQQYYQFTQEFIIYGNIQKDSPSFCNTATFEPTKCTSCNDDMYLDQAFNICISLEECSQRKYHDPENNICKCDPEMFVESQNSDCKDDCSIESPVKYQNQCVQCQVSGCIECQYTNPYECLTCKQNMFNFNYQSCLSTCPEGYKGYQDYYKNWSCQTQCPTNSFKIENNCYQYCPEGYYENSFNMECSKCDENCKSCKGLSNQCTSCKNGLVYFFNQCIENCPQYNYFYNKTQNQCELCSQKCLQCENYDECILCQDNKYYNSNRQCVEQCSIQELTLENEKKCEKCSSNCYSCEKEPSNCTFCWGYDVLDSRTNECVETCSSVDLVLTYTTMTCASEECEENCRQCDPADKTKCYACDSGYYIQNYKCMETCPNKKYHYCCPDELYFYDGQCIEKCPKLTYQEQGRNECFHCEVGCEICDGFSSCLKCLPGFSQKYMGCERDDK